MSAVFSLFLMMESLSASEACRKITSYRGGFYKLENDLMGKIYGSPTCKHPLGMIEGHSGRYLVECISHGDKVVYSLDMAIKWMISRCKEADERANIPWPEDAI